MHSPPDSGLGESPAAERSRQPATPVLLRNSSIYIRPHEARDIQPLFSAAQESIAELSPWMPWCHPHLTREEIANFVELSRNGWADGSQYQFAIFDAASDVVLGCIGLNHIARPNRLANLGYWVRTSGTRRGVASGAARLVASYGFRDLGLTRIEIAAIPSNTASCRVAERVGAKFESLARNRIVMHGRAYDAAVYSLVPEDIVG